MTGMEAAIASGILKVAGNKLVSLLTSEFAAITCVKNDLLELQGMHGEIVSLLSTTREFLMEKDQRIFWVMKLKDVAYDVDDLLYEVHLEAERHKISSGSAKHAIADSLFAKPKSFRYHYKVAQKIKAIRVRIAAITKQRSDMNAIGHTIPWSQPILNRNRTNAELSLLTNVEVSQIQTRDQEKVHIINKLLESGKGEHCYVISIVGLGGSGKTTLAKHICHDNKIKEHFKDKIYWVHVSQEFDLKNLVGKVFEAITKQKSDLHALQNMVDEISEKLISEKFLLVLDDAWHQDREDWNKFKVNLIGKAGSKLLVTTRDQKVAEALQSWLIFRLAFLQKTESWSLFLKYFGWADEDLRSDFVQVGMDIVSKCGRVPLAIKILGGILSDKRDICTWRAINQSDLWNEENIEGRVFASLILSYIHMKDYLKECFLFCSIFPKGYVINKCYLIEQWIANGFIRPTMYEQPEVIGGEYFDLLMKVGFLQDPRETWHGMVYKMHDLIHDLTRYILKSEVTTSPLMNMTKRYTQKCRYLSLTAGSKKGDRVLYENVRALCVLEASSPLDKLVKKSCYLCSIVLQCVVNTKLYYLGYLEIHNVSCTKLPEGISSCWNLQSLCLIFCKGFAALPISIGKLKKLRNLELTCTDIESLPQSIGDSQDLQTLRILSCDKFREVPTTIGKNENLRVLQIIDCMNLQELPSEVKMISTLECINLEDCRGLAELPRDIGVFNNIQTMKLAGCVSLKDLPSTFYSHSLCTLDLSLTGLIILPECVTMMGNLQVINLEACHNLFELPRGIGNLKRLEYLNLKDCWSLRWMSSGIAQLTHLKRLDLYVVGHGGDGASISDLENLDMISGDMVVYNLPTLINSCDAEKAGLKKKKNLKALMLSWPRSVMEEELVLNLGVLDALEPPSYIEKLCIDGYRGSYLPCWLSSHSDSSCWESAAFNQMSQPQFLCMTELRLWEMPNVKRMHGILVLPSLKVLQLVVMANLEELWTTTSGLEIGEEEVGEKYCFPVLSYLEIYHCPKLSVEPYFPPSLEQLALGSCNSQLVSQGHSSFLLLPPYVDEPSIGSRAFATASHLKKLKLSEMMVSASEWAFMQQCLTRLESLELHFCRVLAELSMSVLGLTSLQHLLISDCSALTTLPEWLGKLRSLRTISIRTCRNLKQVSDAIQHLSSLQELWLDGCCALTELPEGIGKLSMLERLHIEYCCALRSLPISIQWLTSLKELHIWRCPELARRYRKGVGIDWHHVSHIPDVDISSCHAWSEEKTKRYPFACQDRLQHANGDNSASQSIIQDYYSV